MANEEFELGEALGRSAVASAIEGIASSLQEGVKGITSIIAKTGVDLPHLDIGKNAAADRFVHVMKFDGAEKMLNLLKSGKDYDEDRAEKCLQQAELRMVKRLVEHTSALGLSGKDADALIDKRSEEISNTAKVGHMILKGDLVGLQKIMVSDGRQNFDPKLLSALLNDAGMNIRVEKKQCDLIISHPGDNFALAVGEKGESRLLGITQGEHPQYFEANFVDENPQKELSDILAKAQEHSRRHWEIDPHYFLLKNNAAVLDGAAATGNIRRPHSNMDAMLQPIEGLEESSK